ncbi:MAG: (d)CMP kinase [Velocimicrobium sp.]
MSYSIAIDGPAGAGKSTIAKQIAKKLGFIYVDTGAMYRAMALYIMREHIEKENTQMIEAACERADITITYHKGEQQVILNGENVTKLIRTEEVGKMASAVGVNKKVRLKLVDLQQKLAKQADVIMDGRDIGTYVLKDATLKIYLTASSKTRAKRRFLELRKKGMPSNLDEIEADIIARDKQDMEREFAPLCQAKDAILLDSSDMNINQVVHAIIEQYERMK